MLGVASLLATARGTPGPLRLPLPTGRGGAVRRQGDARGRRAHRHGGARLVGFHVTSQLPYRLRGPAGGHRHVRGQLPAHHADGAGRARRHPSATGDVIRATAELVSRLGTVATGCATRGPIASAAPGRSTPARPSTWCRPRPGSPARCAPSPRPSARRPWSACRTCATAWATTTVSTSSSRCPSTPGPWSTTPRRPPSSKRRPASCSAPTRSSACRRRAQRRRQRVPPPPPGLLLLRRRRRRRRFERHAPQPDLPRRGRVAPRRRRRPGAQRAGIGLAMTATGTMTR